MILCKHDFHFRAGAVLFSDKPGHGFVQISGQCKHCQTPLIFQGPRGAGVTQPMASVERQQIRAPITVGYAARFDPGPEDVYEGMPEPEFHQVPTQ